MDVDPKARENPPLIHSVSIVVELAAMEQPQARQEPEAAHQPEVDDDDEDSESVSTDLARKVVLVDEADKILRSRAQSAEPRFDLDTGGARIPTGKPPVPLRLAEHQCQQRQSQAGLTTTCGGSSSSGELAERGELSKLGMRRFTHHQVNFSPFATHSDAPLAAGAVADQVRRLADSSGAEGNLFSASSHKQQAGSLVKSWQQRRQSLQISLLTGSSSPSKSLTEEEFRGEREFNEQVRNSRSPEIAGLALAQQQPPLRLRGPSDGPEVLGNFRCKSATTSEDATWTPKPHSIVKSCQQQQDRPSSSSGQRRRVSFSSIDPVLVSRGNLAKSRASFAFFPEPARQASGALSDSNQAGKPAGAPASKLETQTGQLHKRHSNATSASRPSRGQVKELVQEQQGRRCSAATWRAPNQARSMASREQDTGSAGHRCEQAATGASQRVACKSQEFSSSGECCIQPAARLLTTNRGAPAPGSDPLPLA